MLDLKFLVLVGDTLNYVIHSLICEDRICTLMSYLEYKKVRGTIPKKSLPFDRTSCSSLLAICHYVTWTCVQITYMVHMSALDT